MRACLPPTGASARVHLRSPDRASRAAARRPRRCWALFFAAVLGPTAAWAALPAAARLAQEPVEVQPPAPVTEKEIDQAIDRAIRYLLSRQELDGSWKPIEAKYVSGQTGHCLYTLLKAGVAKTHPSIQRGFAYLLANPPRYTYGIACCLLAAQAADAEKYSAEIEAWTATLLEAHGHGFAYPGTEEHPNYVEDLSLTQYGALGLRVAEACGIKVHHDVWEELISYAYSVRNDDGSFSYRPGTEHTGSMTAAGIAVLQIAREALQNQNRMGARETRQIQETMDEAFEWLGENLRMDRNPDPNAKDDEAGHMKRWKLYYLYGLERVGGLTGVRQFGGHDWYEEASNHLVRNQGDQGQWANPGGGEEHPGTCFGVLVLKRATAPTSGTKPRGSRSYGTDDPKLPMSMRITGDTPLTAWVSSFGTKTIKKHEWDADSGKGPRVVRVEYFDDV
ncbi:MAG: prenyltransferase/squalene oxidase repeat-containing protein, partial [Planctomycetota bacterium]